MPSARRLTDAERALVRLIPFEVDSSRVRLYEGSCSGLAGALRRVVLRASRNRAIALGNHVFLSDRCHGNLAVVAHELTHCGQYQAWGPVRYFARGLVAQLRELIHRTLRVGSSPYHYQVEAGKPFREYGMEQQAQMVEDALLAGYDGQAVPSA